MDLKTRLSKRINSDRESGRGELWVELFEITNLYEEAAAQQDQHQMRIFAIRFVEALGNLEGGLNAASRISHGFNLSDASSVHQLIVSLGDALCDLRER